jgi:2-oxoglutarate ferredoxin oxidoreductase subunit delta
MAEESEVKTEAVTTERPAPSKKKPKKQYVVTINAEWCKGLDCRICVEACPVDVIEMKGFTAVPVRMEACTGCDLCEMKCPDFAIRVMPKQ